MTTPVLVFDVNETLLDLSGLDSVFADTLGNAAYRRVWFAKLLHWSTVETITGRHEDFSTLAKACLWQVAAENNVALDVAGVTRIVTAITNLSPHPEVPGALARLKDHGFRLLALTNSAQATVDAQFENAGLTDYFDGVLSVDSARCYKPHPDAYAVAAAAAGVSHADICLIAAHDWDITGAIRAGCSAAFVARGGARLNDVGEMPAIQGPDLQAVADRLIDL